MKKNNGITMVALIITVVILIIIAGISINVGGKAITISKLENLKTNILLIEVKAKEQVENANFDLGTNIDKVTEEEKNTRIEQAKGELKGEEITTGDIFSNNVKITTETIQEENKNNIYYYKISTQDLIGMGLNKLKSSEEEGYYVVRYDLKNTKTEIYNTKGFNYENKIVYSLTEVKEL